MNRALRHSRISEEFRTKTFESFELSGRDPRIVAAWRQAKDYAERFDHMKESRQNSFGIVGAVGSGKTHLICAIANNLLHRGIGVRYFNFVTGFKEMFAKYDEGGQAVEEIRHELQTCEVLMLDDLAKGKQDRQIGQVRVSDAVYNETYAIVEYRYFNRLPILWSSELYFDLIDVLGEATASRLFEMSNISDVTYRDNEPIGSLNYRLRKFVG
ncbi:ATP-binding protein [Effusibacillus pohliae]|uniref:ATP-binding protein n=1 Tax=Effusibacillus pohliae TaxID=232270 RepID=UPI001461447B|nr:ATP-binding protein [Effusibacillus pohliae]